MLLHKIFLVTSQKLHLSTYGKTCTRQNSNSKSDHGSHQNIVLSFSAKKARETGNNWKENRGKALRPLKVSRLLRKKPKKRS